MNSLLTVIAFAAMLGPGEPPSVTVSGDLVTINADFAWFQDSAGVMTMPAGAELVQGTPMVGSSLAASYDGLQPIVWKVPPGTYTIDAFGYPPDRFNPMRVESILSATVAPPGRSQEIRTTLLEISAALYQAGLAKEKLKTLNPTYAELRAAIVGQALVNGQ